MFILSFLNHILKSKFKIYVSHLNRVLLECGYLNNKNSQIFRCATRRNGICRKLIESGKLSGY